MWLGSALFISPSPFLPTVRRRTSRQSPIESRQSPISAVLLTVSATSTRCSEVGSNTYIGHWQELLHG